MLPDQSDSDAHEDARQKSDEETKPGGVTQRALTQVEDPRRFVFVHDSILNRARQSASRRWRLFLRRLGRRPESRIDMERLIRAFVAERLPTATDHELHRSRQ